MKKLIFLLALLCLFAQGAWADGIQKYTPTNRVTELQDGHSYIVYFAGLPTGQDRTGVAYERGANQVGFYYQTKKPHNGFATTSNRFLWTVTSAGDENGYYIQNVGTGMYVGSDGRANKNDANKPEVYIHQWKADGVACAGVDVEGADGARVSNASSSFETEKVWVVKNNASQYWHANQGSFTTWDSGHPVAFYEYSIETVATVNYTINITGTGTVKCGEDVLTNGNTYTSSKLLSASDFTFEGCRYSTVAIDDINMVVNITLTNIDTPDALPTAWNNYNGSNDPTWIQGTSGMVTANTANSASHKYHEWFVNSGDKKGEVTLTFQYTKGVSNGGHRLDISCVEVLNANGTVVNSDAHNGYSGGGNSLNTYTITFPEKNTDYILRIWSFDYQDSFGTITYNWLSDDIAAAKALMNNGVGYPTTESAGYAALNAITEESTRAELQSAKTAYIQETTINLPVSGKAYKLNFLHNNAGKTKRYIKYDANGLGLTTEAGEAATILFTEVDATNHKYIMTLSDGNIVTWLGDGNEGFKVDGSTVKGYSTMVANQGNNDDWNLCWFANQGTDEAQLGTIKMSSPRHANNAANSCWVISNAGAWAKANETSFFGSNGATSALQFEEVTGVTGESEGYKDGVEKYTLYTTAKTNSTTYASYFGEGLGKYHFTDKDAAVQTTGYMDAVKACTTLEQERSVVNSIAINQPEFNKYYTFRGAINGRYITAKELGKLGLPAEKASDKEIIFKFTQSDVEEEETKYIFTAYMNGLNTTSNNMAPAGQRGVYEFGQALAANGTPLLGQYYLADGNSNWLQPWNNNEPQILNGHKNDNQSGWILEEVTNMYAVTINGGDEDSYVQTADEVQIKNGGKLYVATAETEVTASDKDGYTVDVVKNDEAKTITVTYTEAVSVELTSGYYYIKNAASNKYLVNNYDFSTTTTLSGSKVTTNNGVWKVDVNDNGTITLKNGIATPLYVNGTANSTLTVGASTASGVYFTENINGSGDALAIGSEEAATTTWVFEPIASTDKIVDVIINGDNGEGVVSYGVQKATNGGFFRFDGSVVLSAENYSLSEVAGKESSKICHINAAPYYVDAEYFVFGGTAKEELQALIDEIYPNVMSNEIGYPKYNSVINDNDETSTAWGEIMLAYYDRNQIPNAGKSQFIAYLLDARSVANCADINLPEPGKFYTLSNGSETKTYFFKEGNDGLSQLLCYGGTENGQFAQISNDFTSVEYNAIGNDSGVDFAFMAARTNDKGMPVNFGKVCVWQSGEGPLPSGDGNFYSGWTIRKLNALPVNVPASGYSTFWSPVDAKVTGDLKAYTAEVDEDNANIVFHELNDGIIPAGTGVLIAGETGSNSIQALTTVSDPVDSDLKGAEYTVPYAIGDNYDTAYESLYNNNHVDWHAYTLQSGIWKLYNGTKLSGFKAHLELEDLGHAGVKAYTFSFGDDVVTSISDLFGTPQPKQVFDLSGRQVNKAQRGLYIVNGKKVLR